MASNTYIHMDVVIPFKSSINGDEELIYTLRSLELAFPELEDLWIVGDTPKWKGKYVVIPCNDNYRENKWRDRNIFNKMLAACYDERIPEEFLLAHDDNFVLQSCQEILWYPYYNFGSNWKGLGDYANVEANTLELWPRAKNFDVHCPHVMNKKGIFKMKDQLDWTKPYGYCIKTAFAMLNPLSVPGAGEFCPDLKIRGQYELKEVEKIVTAGTRFFSCGDTSFKPGVRAWLANRFPNKSKYEL